MNDIFGDLDYVFVYFGDIFILSKDEDSFEDHLSKDKNSVLLTTQDGDESKPH